MWWAAREAVEHVREHWDATKLRDEVWREELLEDARRAHNKKKERMGSIGSMVHVWIEDLFTAALLGAPAPNFPNNAQAAAACAGFAEWANKQEIRVNRLEQKVLRTQNDGLSAYAGAFDADLTINGVRTLCDWKTSSRLGPAMGAQLGGYDLAMGEMYPDTKFEQHMVVRADRDTGQVETWSTTNTELNKMAFKSAFRLHNYGKVWNK